MRYFFLLTFLFGFGGSVLAQQCNCAKEMLFLEHNMEQNLPSYYDQIILKNRTKPYLKHKQECNKIAKMMATNTECVYLASKYLSFFRDEHLSLSYNDSYYPFSWANNNTDSIRRFFEKEKIFSLPAISKNTGNIEGIWKSMDSKYVVQIIKNKTALWDYAALILSADKQYWTKGQFKFGLQQTGKNKYNSIYVIPNRIPKYYSASLADSVLTIGRINIFHRITDSNLVASTTQNNNSRHLEFKELSPTTNYICIPAFNFELHTAIDSLIKTNLKTITTKPNLIIDVRNNGGGGDRSYQSLLPLVLDKKMYPNISAIATYASPETIQYYTDTKYMHCETKEDSLDDDNTLQQMNLNKGKYTTPTPDTLLVDTVYSYPQKVAIIANRWCASATEGFIIDALRSKKVTLYGENTWGMCSYGDWRSANMPCLPITISIPTKRTLAYGYEDIEAIGITPNKKLDPKLDTTWIKIVQNDIEK